MQPDYNTFKSDFRNFVLASTAVTDLIGTRFFGAQIGTLRDVVFPSAFFFPDPGIDMIQGIIQDFNLNIHAFSDVSYDEAHSVLDAIRNRILNAVIPTRIIVNARTTPTEAYNETSRLFGVYAKFRIHRVLAQ